MFAGVTTCVTGQVWLYVCRCDQVCVCVCAPLPCRWAPACCGTCTTAACSWCGATTASCPHSSCTETAWPPTWWAWCPAPPPCCTANTHAPRALCPRRARCTTRCVWVGGQGGLGVRVLLVLCVLGVRGVPEGVCVGGGAGGAQGTRAPRALCPRRARCTTRWVWVGGAGGARGGWGYHMGEEKGRARYLTVGVEEG